MVQFEQTIEDYKILFKEVNEREITIDSVRGFGSRLTLPSVIDFQNEKYTLKRIGKKAFMGCKTLREISIPYSVKEIEDWAFAQCSQLTSVNMPSDLILGLGVFADCPCLLQLCREAEGGDFSFDLSILLATCATKLPSEDLLRDMEAGSGHWYQKWDQRLETFLKEDDQEGYQDMVLCGEEDIRKNVPEFIFDKQMLKSSLCMIRLIYSEGITEEARKIFVDYILAHIKGCESDAAWKVIVKEYGDRLVYYDLLAEIGGIHKDNIDAMIEDLDSGLAEAKAYLIRYKQDYFAKEDAFSAFDL